jgi:hypothetical protein
MQPGMEVIFFHEDQAILLISEVLVLDIFYDR